MAKLYLRPKKKIFDCYDSFALAETLVKEGAECGAVNTDSGVDNRSNFRNFLRQFIPLALVLGLVIFLVGYFLYNLYLGVTTSVKPDSVAAEQIEKPATENNKIVCITPSAVLFADGKKLKVGDQVKGYKIEKFQKNYFVGVDADNSRHCLKYSNVR